MNVSPPSNPTVILVRGAWADGSSWQRVIPLLLAKGIPVVAVQNPTTSLADDVAATRRALNAIDGPVVLVGHSWRGAAITEAGNDPKVKALVYVAAFAPKAGETVGEFVNAHASSPGLAQVRVDGAGFLPLSSESWMNDVGQDLPEDEARVLVVLQPPLAASTFGDKISTAAWETRPNWYIVSAEDRIVSVELERALAAKMGAKTTGGHLALLSMPEALAEVIIDAFDAIAAAA